MAYFPKRDAHIRRGCRHGTALVLLLLSLTGFAESKLTFDVGQIEGAGWSLRHAAITLSLDDAQNLTAAISIGEMRLPEPIGELRDLTIRCVSLQVENGRYRCEHATIFAAVSPLDAESFSARIAYDPSSMTIRFGSDDLPFAGTRLRLDLTWEQSRWQADVGVESVDINALRAAVSDFVPIPDNLDVGGDLGLTLTLDGTALGASAVEMSGSTSNLSLANDAGTLATEGLALAVELSLSQAGETSPWSLSLDAVSDGGEAYAEPVYLNLGEMPARFRLTGSLDATSGRLNFEMLELDQPKAMVASADGSIDFSGDEILITADAEVDGRFPGFYKGWLKGFLAGTSASDLATSGRLTASIRVEKNIPRALDLKLHEFNADDSDARFAFFDAGGEISWRAVGLSAPPRDSSLRWGGGFLYGIGYGAASLKFIASGEQFSLLEPLRLPLLDGALVIETLNAAGWRSENPAVEFDAVLEPLNLRELTTTMGWPAFGGLLAGKLPLLRLKDGVVTLVGSMEAQAFDGRIRVEDLSIQQPFSNLPIISGSVFMEGLDLRLLTDVFTVGHITGRLDGYIKNLQVVQGEAVAFDASFHTPPGDRSKRKISRRALDNLSEIAGGGTALLSSPFLKLFENFSYAKLGLSCRLAKGVCNMNGVEEAPNGYYLVKGSLVPRIDVIGHSKQVNWQRLLSQIELAMQRTDDTSSNEESQ